LWKKPAGDIPVGFFYAFPAVTIDFFPLAYPPQAGYIIPLANVLRV
jgi:hypothetical protein